ncbi:DinB family protein [Streptomyces sp. VRA16 Mangrove soil]|uniref:DinB family protein n=1 Tax=Streptomyces sp. VRA16 Mangrove soil TaxID=2817434 RepID=UPI001A9F3460|nr:DinB family protein [Streptomyces sp. VRA16 Mangrove soil]MBO1337640.1 DinB family protein [Streptomyces sp. VRA16 Mangrove soil]
MTTTPDGRPVPPPHADERTTLESWLDFHRATLALKCADLADAQARTAAVPTSALTLLGLVQHLAEVERNWFQRILAGAQVPPVFPDSGPDGFALTADRTLADALTQWRAEVTRSRELAAARALDAPGTLSPQEAVHAGTSTISLRWILTHLIEEYARHNGHADLLREAVDGVTGA